jgi:hypothetical protein
MTLGDLEAEVPGRERRMDGQHHPGMRPTAAARLYVAQPLQPGNGDRAREQGDLGDRTTTWRFLQAYPGPRPPRAITEDGGGRKRVVVRAQQPQNRDRDGRGATSVALTLRAALSPRAKCKTKTD